MSRGQGSTRHGPIWRSFFDPLYTSRYAYAIPVLIGGIAAIIMGIAGGWGGVLGGIAMGLFLEGLYGARALLIRYKLRQISEDEKTHVLSKALEVGPCESP